MFMFYSDMLTFKDKLLDEIILCLVTQADFIFY